MRTRYIDNAKLVSALGLQAGEGYEQTEECHTHLTDYEHNGVAFEVYFDEMASPFSQWKSFCAGIGTRSHMEREKAIRAMQIAIDNRQRAQEEKAA